MMLRECHSNDVLQALDHPVWAALTTRQAHLGTVDGTARAFRCNIGPFATAGPIGQEDETAMARLVAGKSDGVVLMQAHDIPTIAGVASVDTALGVQMLPTRRIAAGHCTGLFPLSRRDVPDMLKLVNLTKPGPFREETVFMGNYMGVRVGGELIAMAGERMKFPGFTEISAVCVRHDFRGRGYARALTCLIASRIFDRGETPFLHGFADNVAAISLYRDLGFHVRRTMQIARLVKAQAR